MENYFTKVEIEKILADREESTKKRIDDLIESTEKNH